VCGGRKVTKCTAVLRDRTRTSFLCMVNLSVGCLGTVKTNALPERTYSTFRVVHYVTLRTVCAVSRDVDAFFLSRVIAEEVPAS
jgi:hypothetical protein